MPMEGFTKGTLFNDLPAIIKQKIINIRNLSFPSSKPTSYPPIKSFGHIAIPSSKSLSNTFLRMAESPSALDRETDATDCLRKEIAEFTEFVNCYRMEINETDFVGEFEKTIGLMESKYEKLTRDLDIL